VIFVTVEPQSGTQKNLRIDHLAADADIHPKYGDE